MPAAGDAVPAIHPPLYALQAAPYCVDVMASAPLAKQSVVSPSKVDVDVAPFTVLMVTDGVATCFTSYLNPGTFVTVVGVLATDCVTTTFCFAAPAQPTIVPAVPV